jgi:hypothetical protein
VTKLTPGGYSKVRAHLTLKLSQRTYRCALQSKKSSNNKLGKNWGQRKQETGFDACRRHQCSKLLLPA